jgi:hypothetical protein
MTSTLRRRLAVSCVLVCLAGAAVAAQRFGGGERSRRVVPQDVTLEGNTPYDGRFVFARISYPTSGGYRRIGNGGYPWSHDYPEGEVHFSKILEEYTLLNIRTNGSNILALDDPELFNYPVAYMAEPGFWLPSESEADSFRKYLLKGGFVIFDDFRGYDWNNLQEQMRRVLPELHFVELDGTANVFHSFYEINSPLDLVPPYGGQVPSYWGIFEENNPRKRLMAIANVNNDISEYWEYSETGVSMVSLTNNAYKFGVNYVIYGLTH